MRLYIYAAILVFFLGTNAWSYRQGKARERDKSIAAALEFREKENMLIADLQKAQAKREVIFLDRVKVVEKAVGQCLDTPLDPAVLDELHKSEGDKTKPSPDR